MKKKTGIIIQIICAAVFICCAVYLGGYFYESRHTQNEIEKLRETVEDSGKTEEEYASNGMLSCYFDLYNQNSDLTGWIKTDDAKIDYPVMLAADNDEYMHKGFTKQYQYSGLPFADCQCDPDKPSDNVIIYAHNMKDGSMFAHLLKYESEDFYRAHPQISFDTLYKRGTYEIIYAFRSKVGADNEFRYYDYINFGSEEEFDDFIAAAKKLSLYDTGKSAEYGDKLLTLSTCSYNSRNERFVVIAKRIK